MSRWRRFRRHRPGLIACGLIVTAFFLSLFLELYCNHRPLYVRYGEYRAWPAVANWLNLIQPFHDFNDRVMAKDVGLPDEGELKARAYARWVNDPWLLEEEGKRLEQEVYADEQRFQALLQEQARQQGLKTAAPLPDWKKEESAEKRARARELRRLGGTLAGGHARIVMPLYPYSPQEQLLDLAGAPPHAPFQKDGPPLGTDQAGRDVLSQLLYGFRASLAFGLGVALVGTFVGLLVGGAMGYYGGWVDLITQRIIEIWGSIPFLFTVMILASVLQPGFWSLAVLLVVLTGWVPITVYMRGEFYREKARDYVQAARALGIRDGAIMWRHILPNALVPIITFLPFDIVGNMAALVSLDYLGFGLPEGYPSWGALLRQGADNIVNHPHLVYLPVLAFAGTLLAIVLIGEAVREAFDPKEYARLR